MLVRTILESDEEFTVVGEATNGDEAVRLAGLHAPDVVVLDLAMPVSDGVEALVRLRQEGPGRKVLLLSGLGPDEMGDETAEADGYLEKMHLVRSLPGTIKQLCTDEREV